jgi:Ca-activated chloride channel homolog
VLDRSHSMCFDFSGVNFQYPDMSLPLATLYNMPPDPSLSRWSALRDSVNGFLSVTNSLNPPPRVGLVTWASNINEDFTEVTFESNPSQDTTSISSVIASRGANKMWGATNCAAGIDAGVAMLRNRTNRPYANKIMILMTDGMWNKGRSPVLAAQDAAAQGIVIHVVTLLPAADQPDMQQVAAVTGGLYYHANDPAALTAAFQTLARSIPAVLTE